MQLQHLVIDENGMAFDPTVGSSYQLGGSAQEIIELIDREADLLMRGVREANLEGLRRRISTLFLLYIKTSVLT